MIRIVFGMGAILGPKFDRNMKNTDQKNNKKLIVKKTTFLARFGVFGWKIIEI